MNIRMALLLLLLPALAGCSFERHSISQPGVNQVIRVASGDRWFMDLEENATTGYQWSCKSDDADVEVAIRHVSGKGGEGLAGVPGKAEVTIRVHRGYDGPSTLTFAYKRTWEREPVKRFTITLFKRAGDSAFWE